MSAFAKRSESMRKESAKVTSPPMSGVKITPPSALGWAVVGKRDFLQLWVFKIF